MQEMRKTWVRALGQEDTLKEGVATHSSTLAWRIPGPVLCLVGYSPQDHKELDMTEHAVTHPPVQAAWILLVSP